MAGDSEDKGGALPPKLDLRKGGILKDKAAKPASVIKLQPLSDAEKAAAAAEADERSQTMRIKIPEVESLAETPRLDFKPATTIVAKTLKVEKPAAAAEAKAPLTTVKPSTTIAPKTKPGGELPPSKKETSRIPLEAALAPEEKETKEPSTGPKTIRLKRPSEATTIKVSQRPMISKIGEEAPAEEAMGKTSPLDEAVAELEDTSTPTKRKTIRVKRPTKRPGVESVSMPVAGAEEQPEEAKAEVAAVPADEPGLAFSLVAIAAVVVACVAIYVLAAQTVAPDLPWPGRISIIR